MYKVKLEDINIYFLCYKKDSMPLYETYYDEILNTLIFYFNSYIAYNYWKNNFKNLKINEEAQKILTIGAYCYLDYTLKNNEFKNKREKNKQINNLKTIKYIISKTIIEYQN